MAPISARKTRKSLSLDSAFTLRRFFVSCIHPQLVVVMGRRNATHTDGTHRWLGPCKFGSDAAAMATHPSSRSGDRVWVEGLEGHQYARDPPAKPGYLSENVTSIGAITYNHNNAPSRLHSLTGWYSIIQDWYNVNRNFVIIGCYYFLLSQQLAWQYLHTILCLRQFTPNSENVIIMALKMPRVGNAGYSSRYRWRTGRTALEHDQKWLEAVYMRHLCHGAEDGVDRGRCLGDLAHRENVAWIECVRGGWSGSEEEGGRK